MKYPPISCVCPTYGRVHMVEESIKCFLKQDYKGKKQLVIFNNFPQQQLVFKHPEIKIVNSTARNLGNARNLSVEAADYDIIANWDDDDIYLPHSLSIRMKFMKTEFSKFTVGFYYFDGNHYEVTTNIFHGQAIFTKNLYNKISGYSETDVGEDTDFEQKIPNDLKYVYESKRPYHRLHYVYRWSGSILHISTNSRKKMEMDVLEKIKKGIEPSGKILLKPKWDRNYIKDVKQAIRKIKTKK